MSMFSIAIFTWLLYDFSGAIFMKFLYIMSFFDVLRFIYVNKKSVLQIITTLKESCH